MTPNPYPAPPEWWPFDLPAWRGLVRTGPAGAVEGVLFAAKSLVSLLDETPVTNALGAVLQASMLLTLGLMVLVVLYNRPAWAVAPRFRAFPGALAEWNGEEPPRDPLAESQGRSRESAPCTTTTAASRTTSRSSRGGERSRPSPAGSAC